ncbi:MAG: hypothetical protein KGZ86_03180 [Candidatus Latescibacteria bacterium]|nr:hypothetical protein [Candidatus Latescibacterota bacterium]
MKKNILISCLLFFALSWFSLSYAIYYNIPYFAKSAGLGEATVSSLGEISGFYKNPAVMNSNTVSFNLTEWLVETRAGSVIGSYNIKDYFMLGGGLTYFSYGQMRSYDEYGNPLEYFSAGLWQYQISAAKQLYNQVSLGIGLKGLHQTIAQTSETKFIGNFGVIYYAKMFNIGISVHDPTDVSFDAGVSVKPVQNLVLLGAINYQEEIKFKAGIEYTYQPIALRVGYNEKHITAGIGYIQKGFQFDYAIVDHDLLGLTHHFSITIK